MRLNNFQLKLSGIIFMLIEYINLFFGETLNLPTWLSWLSHFVSPLFLYILTEGYFHTTNKRNDCLRLLYGMMIMTLINLVYACSTGNFNFNHVLIEDLLNILTSYNIFQTFLLFILMFILIDSYLSSSSHSIFKFIGIVLTGMGILMSDNGAYLLPIGLIFYAVKARKRWSALSIGVFSLLLLARSLLTYLNHGFLSGSLYDYLTLNNQFTMVISALFITLYNGERGGSGAAWQKYIFYIFYPLQFIVIYMLLYFN